MTAPRPDGSDEAPRPKTLVRDVFSDDRKAGAVLGTPSSSGMARLGCDSERQMAVDHGALRLQPLSVPGWGRQSIAYGPFQRTSGLILAVSIINGHNTSEGGPIPEHIVARLWRWMIGPGVDPLIVRLMGWIKAPRKRLTLRRLLWWSRIRKKNYKGARLDENLAVGFFKSAAPTNPLTEGNGFVVHAALGENGELWARVGDRTVSAFRQLHNLQVYYFVALRERGAIYYAATTETTKRLPGFPSMRPIAIDPYSAEQTLFAGVHQSALGQIGFRVDTRVQGIHVAHIPDFATPFATAHAAAAAPLHSIATGSSQIGGAWRISAWPADRPPDDLRGVTATLHPPTTSGLVHVLIQTADNPDSFGLVWRSRDAHNFWQLTLSQSQATLACIEDGVEAVVAVDYRDASFSERFLLSANPGWIRTVWLPFEQRPDIWRVAIRRQARERDWCRPLVSRRARRRTAEFRGTSVAHSGA